MEPTHRIGLIVAGLLIAAGLVLSGRWAWGERQSRDPAPRPSIAMVNQAAGVERGVVVEVINATGREGLARQVTRLLREQGVDVVYFGSTDRRPDSTTVIIRRGVDPERGRPVARMVGTKRVTVEADSTRRVDLTILLGADYRLPAGRLPL
ncbi:MAG: LytR C-terminal domain-containing protein [Gemmatimonadales bacterium]|nr:LytR C-terminal domain-containing protein [Gemmatimonadales bacterium]